MSTFIAFLQQPLLKWIIQVFFSLICKNSTKKMVGESEIEKGLGYREEEIEEERKIDGKKAKEKRERERERERERGGRNK